MHNPYDFHTAPQGSLDRSSFTPVHPYALRPPSPPTVEIPASRCVGRISVTITPSPKNLDPSLYDLNSDYTSIITHGGAAQEAVDQVNNWEYSSRRSAQSILDPSLWLGPLSVVRDKAWMEREGITMVVVVRDLLMGLTGLMSGLGLGVVQQSQGQQKQSPQPKTDGTPKTIPTLGPAAKKVCQELNVEVEAVGVSSLQELIREFPRLNEKMVRHLISVHKQTQGSKQGKVLVCCETGNERSAAVAVAYLVEVWGCGLIEALRFVLYRRFCVAWDDDTRRYLKNYEDILQAKRMRWQVQGANERNAQQATNENRKSKLKRQLAAGEDDDASENDDGDAEMFNGNANGDSDASERQAREHAQGRGPRRNFAPFVERLPRRNNNDGTEAGMGGATC